MSDPRTIIERRRFLQAALAAGTAAAWPLHAQNAPPRRELTARTAAASRTPGEKLRLAIIGVAARGRANLDAVAHEEIAALCDIDEKRLNEAASVFPSAKKYFDYRELFDRETDLDAVVVSTPDHTHAIPVALALQRKLPVYCEKPLAHSVYEVRALRLYAAAAGVPTQMGTQIHAQSNYRRVVELIQAGAIGRVRNVLVWLGGKIIPGPRPTMPTEVPKGIHYDLWLGPAPFRPFHTAHFHFNWRYWWDFGGGLLADFGCHYMDLPFWALGLKSPTRVAARGEKDFEGDNDVPGAMQVDYEFPVVDRDGQRSTVTMSWYHGAWTPPGAGEYGKSSAVLFEGEQGRLLADYTTHKLFLQQGRTFETPPPTIPESVGHHQEWLDAIRHGTPTTCNFEYSGALAESVLVGNVAYRAGKTLEWDQVSLRATNCPEADAFVRREYRPGWNLP